MHVCLAEICLPVRRPARARALSRGARVIIDHTDEPQLQLPPASLRPDGCEVNYLATTCTACIYMREYTPPPITRLVCLSRNRREIVPPDARSASRRFAPSFSVESTTAATAAASYARPARCASGPSTCSRTRTGRAGGFCCWEDGVLWEGWVFDTCILFVCLLRVEEGSDMRRGQRVFDGAWSSFCFCSHTPTGYKVGWGFLFGGWSFV